MMTRCASEPAAECHNRAARPPRQTQGFGGRANGDHARRLGRGIALLVLLGAVAGCAGTGPRPEWTTAPNADLAAFSTYDWADEATGEPRRILDSQVRNAVRDELLEKGYERSAESPDFLIDYEPVDYERGQRGSPVTIGIGVGSWGGRVGGSVGTSVGVGSDDPDQRYRLMIRVLDSERSEELWVGATSAFELPAEARVIERVVGGVLRGFPARAN